MKLEILLVFHLQIEMAFFSPKEPKKFPFHFMFSGLGGSWYNFQSVLWFSSLEMTETDVIISYPHAVKGASHGCGPVGVCSCREGLNSENVVI